ncbi:MAG: TIGR03067 domain-containing protein [Gemmataceae bacterium]|nr:TIGR03067 domain-containing protein [Gemmataceae bacterium]
MWVTKLKLLAAVVLTAGVLGTGIGLGTHQVLADKRTPPAQASGPRLSAQANQAPSDGEKLQGSWRVVAFERDGKPDLAQRNKQIRWVFRAGKVSIQQNALERAAGTYELVDQAKNPKWIDLELTETMLGQERTVIYLGIYQLEGDTLKLCFAPPALPGIGLLRPTEFDTREALKWGWSLLVLKREPDTVQRQQRQLRWTLRFDTRDGRNYLRQLQALGAILAIPDEESQFRVIRDLSQRPAQGKIEEIAQLNRIYWIDQKPHSVASLSLALGLAAPPRFLVAFFPEKVEQDLLRLELAHVGRKEEEIAETHFEVVKKGDGYELKVRAQTAR